MKKTYVFLLTLLGLSGIALAATNIILFVNKDKGAASSTKEFVITFESNGGTHIDTKRVKDGEKVSEPAKPTKTDYTFDAWYTTADLSDKYNFDNLVTKDFTLYAKWIKEPKIIGYMENYSKVSDYLNGELVLTTEYEYNNNNLVTKAVATSYVTSEEGVSQENKIETITSSYDDLNRKMCADRTVHFINNPSDDTTEFTTFEYVGDSNLHKKDYSKASNKFGTISTINKDYTYNENSLLIKSEESSCNYSTKEGESIKSSEGTRIVENTYDKQGRLIKVSRFDDRKTYNKTTYEISRETCTKAELYYTYVDETEYYASTKECRDDYRIENGEEVNHKFSILKIEFTYLDNYHSYEADQYNYNGKEPDESLAGRSKEIIYYDKFKNEYYGKFYRLEDIEAIEENWILIRTTQQGYSENGKAVSSYYTNIDEANNINTGSALVQYDDYGRMKDSISITINNYGSNPIITEERVVREYDKLVPIYEQNK